MSLVLRKDGWSVWFFYLMVNRNILRACKANRQFGLPMFASNPLQKKNRGAYSQVRRVLCLTIIKELSIVRVLIYKKKILSYSVPG